MASSAIPLCDFDDDHIQGTAVGPSHGDVIVTAQEDGVFVHSTLSMVQKQAWALSSSALELSQAAAWDTRTQHFYAVAAVRSGAAKIPEKGPQQRLLVWPASYMGALEDSPVNLELHSAVHAVHPIFPAAQSTEAATGSATGQAHEQKALDEQHNSSSGAEKGSALIASTPQKRKEDSTGKQQMEALLHTRLPSIRTKLKQRPGKRKSALTPPSIAQLPWMQEWIATGKTAEDREAEQKNEASTSGRSGSAAESTQQGIPGVFIIHADGTVATDVAYPRHVEKHTNGSADAQVLASAAAEGMLAVVTKSKKRRQSLHLYMLQGNALQLCGEFQLQPPEKAAEVASGAVSEHRLVLLWTNGVLQSFSHQPASNGQVSLKMHYQRKVSGFPEVASEKTKQSTPTPKKRTASVAAASPAQHAKHSRPSVTLCGSGLLAVAAYVSSEDSAPHAGASQAGQLELLAQSKPTDHSNTNGPIATPGKPWKANSKAGAANGPLSPTQQLKPAVLRVVVLDDTYGCTQHIRDLTRADHGADADAPSEPRQLQILALQQRSSISLVVGLQSRALLIRIKAEPVTMASMVEALSLNRQQHPSAALQQKALDLQQEQAPVHSHFRPCWTQRGAAVGLSMLPHIGKVAVDVPGDKLSRWQAAAESIAGECRAESETLQQLRQPGSLPTADMAQSLVRDMTEQAQQHGASAVSQELLQMVAERCTEAGYWEGMQLLAQQPQLPAFKALQGMLPKLAEHGQFLVLACALTQARDVPPVHLGATLGVLLGGISTGMQDGIKQWSSYIGSTADAAVKAAEASFGMEGAHEAMLAKAQAVVMATDGFTAQEVCLHAALAAGHDQAVLQAALQRLQQPQVARLIAYLLKWVIRHTTDDHAEKGSVLAPGVALPPMKAVLRWACATLDTHFVTLAGLPAGGQQAMLLLHNHIQETLQLSQGVAALSGALQHIHNQAPLPALSSSNSQQYFVELLDLSIRAA